MTPKHQTIVSAAHAMFIRYGYAKTTMNDIAREAGVARQTLYNAFPGKPEILRAVVRLMGDTLLEEVENTWEGVQSPEEKLQVFHDLFPLRIYDITLQTPDASALWEGMYKEAAAEIAAMNMRWLEMLTEVLSTDAAAQGGGFSPKDIAEFFFSASLNAKYGADDRDHLVRRLVVIKSATMALIAPTG